MRFFFCGSSNTILTLLIFANANLSPNKKTVNYFHSFQPEYIVKPYSSIEDIFNELRSARWAYEVKYIAPETPINWEWKIRHCVSMIKINKFIYDEFYSLRKEHNFAYRSKLFWNERTCSVEYGINNYTFNIKTGLSFKSNNIELINTRVNIHSQLEEFLGGLLNQIRNTLPSNRAKELLEIYTNIKDKQSY